MISNHEEYSNDITLENLKWRKSNKELEVIELAFIISYTITILSCYSYFAEQYSCN